MRGRDRNCAQEPLMRPGYAPNHPAQAAEPTSDPAADRAFLPAWVRVDSHRGSGPLTVMLTAGARRPPSGAPGADVTLCGRPCCQLMIRIRRSVFARDSDRLTAFAAQIGLFCHVDIGQCLPVACSCRGRRPVDGRDAGDGPLFRRMLRPPALPGTGCVSHVPGYLGSWLAQSRGQP